MMISKNFVSRLAAASSRKGLAASVVYGLSLAVRFTSAAGEEVEFPPPSAHRVQPLTSIMSTERSPLPWQDWSRKSAQPIVFRQGWPPGSPGCLAP
jgi:hypothetical protein